MPVLTRTAPQVCLLPGGHHPGPGTHPHSPKDIPTQPGDTLGQDTPYTPRQAPPTQAAPDKPPLS